MNQLGKTFFSARLISCIVFAVSSFTALHSLQARVFSFDDQYLSTYLRGTGGLSSVGQTGFGNASGTETSFSEEVNYDYSGGIGLTLSYQKVTLRLGVEAILPQEVFATGANTAGTELLSVTSENLAVVPNVALEFQIHRLEQTRFMFGLGAGLASLTLKNTYDLTAEGESELGVSDYSEVMEGSALGGQAYFIMETLFTDNVTFTSQIGYRYYKIESLEHTQASTTINGTVVEGSPALNSDGGQREVELKGFYIGLGLRFYISLH